MGFPGGSAGKESACNVGDPSWIPGLGRSLGEGIGYPLQYSGLENSMDSTVTQSRTRLSDFHFTDESISQLSHSTDHTNPSRYLRVQRGHSPHPSTVKRPRSLLISKRSFLTRNDTEVKLKMVCRTDW